RRQTNVELTSTALDCLSRAGYTMDDVDAVLVGRGPGSFTGVRIGIATAKGVACGLGCPLHGTSTLDAAAWNAWLHGERGLLGVVGDAMRGEVYPGIYVLDNEGPMRTFPTETVIKAKACVDEWAARSDRDELILTGDGLKKYKAQFEAAGFARFVDETAWHPCSEGLLRAAASPDRYDPNDNGDPALVLPIYTRLSDAEENERQRLGLAQPKSAKTSGVYEGLSGIHTQLRPMSVNDIAQVAALEADAFAGAAHEPWSEKLFYEDLTSSGRTWWVAHDQGTIVGFAGGMLAGDRLEVMDIAVRDDRRHEGIGSRLLARLAYDGQTLGASEITLEVHVGNESARGLYESVGFEQVGLRRDYYGPGNDALVMTAALPLAIDTEKTGERPEPRPSVRPWPIVPAPRSEEAAATIAAAGPLVLAIESSCDETAIAIINGAGEVLSNVVATQIDFHARFGGVVPEIASRKHIEAICGVCDECLDVASRALAVPALRWRDLDAVAVTYAPGLVGALV
ncbi:MAG: tRNA (adenosine(37)-N6)-threonylcarbamoyltransferase complex dimerization subunit type 1 TsaB, partial [Atopobiaceae bacterium]|nr:tRNA (adenosine(37)-N6)-threonylcarbamoyltransferase complex dimerization subunit type 1 TsaB [Atopobiaceae bacterium]